MKRWGVLLMVIGIGSSILPLIDPWLQLWFILSFGVNPLIVGVIVGILGLVLFVAGSNAERKPPTAAMMIPSPPAKVTQNLAMRCVACGAENPLGAQFCGSCGNSLAPAMPPRILTCPGCGAAMSPGESFCGQCRASLEMTPAQTAVPRRRRWSYAVGAIVVIAVVGVVLWNNGFFTRSDAVTSLLSQLGLMPRPTVSSSPNPPPANPPPARPPVTNPSSPLQPQLGTPKAVIDSASIEPNVFDDNGWFGFRILINFSASGIDQVRLVAYFYDDAGVPLKTTDRVLADSAGDLAVGSMVNASSSNSTAQPFSLFMPYYALELPLGNHTIQILPSIWDQQRNLLAKGPLSTLNYQQDASAITRVQVAPNVTDSSGQQGILVTTSFISNPLSGPQGLVIVYFRDASGQPLPGNGAYTDSNGNLATWLSYTAPAVRSRYSDVRLFLPYTGVPVGMRELSATISLYDPASRRFLTPYIPFMIRLPG